MGKQTAFGSEENEDNGGGSNDDFEENGGKKFKTIVPSQGAGETMVRSLQKLQVWRSTFSLKFMTMIVLCLMKTCFLHIYIYIFYIDCGGLHRTFRLASTRR